MIKQKKYTQVRPQRRRHCLPTTGMLRLQFAITAPRDIIILLTLFVVVAAALVLDTTKAEKSNPKRETRMMVMMMVMECQQQIKRKWKIKIKRKNGVFQNALQLASLVGILESMIRALSAP